MSSASGSYILPVELSKSYRLLNHGPTVLVSARHAGESNAMAAAWACALDYTPAKLTVVIDKATKTRQLMEQSGMFVIQVPTRAQARLVHHVGTRSALKEPGKIESAGVEWFEQAGFDVPLVAGCSAWMVCRLVPEPHNQAAYDLFIGEIVGAWADSRVFRDGHWLFEDAPDELRSLHYIAGGHFYAIGDAVTVDVASATAKA
ncbi:flavin reductase family protein [Diaphorobacter sp. HDW4B]|uniref:flavin reductase family protein n=1 Tax=Diaphorobacter sp. HDW4B TaxID=2714925 RepID=UPI0014091233|nr:flavin reductase family protein [Diaphorobacter sp. HDW4B]QIL70154.1 flavin reductase family protein [Diaphorobacter sp. HDW4B]